MKQFLVIKKYLPYVLLVTLVLFNFYLYQSEFKVLIDPNDNTFHYSLIDEAKSTWGHVFEGKLSPMYLLDSWNELWAEGFSLSYYYSHLPEIVISLLSILISMPIMQLFVIIRSLILILLPLSFFLGAKILGFSPWFGIIFAYLSHAIFTDGLYGLDQSSFLWRGWGLFSQLLAVFFLPLAFAYGVDYIKNKKNLSRAIVFNFLLAQSHFGMFYLLLFAYPVYWVFSLDKWQAVGKRILVFVSLTIITLSYFILPFFLTSQYRNFSLWDPIWKFDSWGLNQIIIWLANGDLFDFNRFPFLTIFVTGGILWGLMSGNKFYKYLVTIFVLYFILFLGRGLLGPLVNFIPGMSEFHIHRVIIMVQFVGLLIASGFLYSILQSIMNARIFKYIFIGLSITIVSFSTYLIEKPIINYAKDNNIWIERSNNDYQKNIHDYQSIANTLKKLPSARVYAGRPGNWGRDFKLGDTQIYMVLSQDGFPTIGFLPQSWSPNSDAEQFFDEENQKHYDLYNVGYMVLPVYKKPPKFAKLIAKKGKFSLYKVNSEGWFTLGKSSLEVETKKDNLVNIVHLWFYSNMFINNDYPVIALNNERFTFVDRVIKMDGQNRYDVNKVIWQANPIYSNQEKFEQVLINKLEKKNLQGYEVSFRLENKCDNCIVILKQTFHPNWKITVNGKEQNAFPVFPFFTAIQINQPGNYEIITTYKPSNLKIMILIFSILFIIFRFNFKALIQLF